MDSLPSPSCCEPAQGQVLGAEELRHIHEGEARCADVGPRTVNPAHTPSSLPLSCKQMRRGCLCSQARWCWVGRDLQAQVLVGPTVDQPFCFSRTPLPSLSGTWSLSPGDIPGVLRRHLCGHVESSLACSAKAVTAQTSRKFSSHLLLLPLLYFSVLVGFMTFKIILLSSAETSRDVFKLTMF